MSSFYYCDTETLVYKRENSTYNPTLVKALLSPEPKMPYECDITTLVSFSLNK